MTETVGAALSIGLDAVIVFESAVNIYPTRRIYNPFSFHIQTSRFFFFVCLASWNVMPTSLFSVSYQGFELPVRLQETGKKNDYA